MRIKRWVGSPGGLVTIILLLVITSIFVINNYIFSVDISEYLSGTTTEMIGIIVTVNFVQLLFDKSLKKIQSKMKQKQYIV